MTEDLHPELSGALRKALERALRETAAAVFGDAIVKAATWPETKDIMGISELFVREGLSRVEAALSLSSPIEPGPTGEMVEQVIARSRKHWTFGLDYQAWARKIREDFQNEA